MEVIGFFLIASAFIFGGACLLYAECGELKESIGLAICLEIFLLMVVAGAYFLGGKSQCL